jgi:peptidoglycan DL-endopeptidase CwlO
MLVAHRSSRLTASLASLRPAGGSLLLRLLFGALTALVLGLGPSTHAYAAPSPEEIERQIDTLWEQLEPIIEQYNAVNSELKTNRLKADLLKKQLDPLESQVDLALGKVQTIAVQAYKGGRINAFNAVLMTGSPTGLADQLSRLDMVARRQRAQISDVAVVRDKYATDKRALDQLIAQQAAQEADLAAKKKEIEARIGDLQKLRQQAYGSGGGVGNLRPAACPAEYGPGAAATAVRTACAQIGKMYLFAAEGPDRFDCSGLTQYSWKSAGKSLPRTSSQQYGATRRITRAELALGDLVFYYGDLHHVGIYVGGGWMVHASRSGEPVRMVQIDRFGRSPVGYGRVT